MPPATHRNRSTLRVLIAGGGVAALEALLALRRLAGDRIAIELVAAEPQFWYRPLAVAEPFGLGEVHGLDLSVIADKFGAVVTLGTIEQVEPGSRIVRTAAGAELEYEVLLLAVGARPVNAVAGALTFRGLADTDAFRGILADLDAGTVNRIVFAIPGTVGWVLPLYELALQTAAFVGRRGAAVEIILVTPEEQPLELFGRAASSAVSDLLETSGVRVQNGSYPVAFRDGRLACKAGADIAADRVVALPRLAGPAIEGVPSDARGFIPTDTTGRVHGLADVFAAGDATRFPIKQGGLAAQQADAAAESIAALAGAEISPRPFRPILRGLILTGGAPLFARTELASPGNSREVGMEALWWPPGKVVGRYLAPFLAEHSGAILTPPSKLEAIAVDLESDPVLASASPS